MAGRPIATQVNAFRLAWCVVGIQLVWLFGFPQLSPGSVIQYPFFVYGAAPTLGTLLLAWHGWRRMPAANQVRVVWVGLSGALLLSQGLLLHRSLMLSRVLFFQPVITSALVGTLFVTRSRSARSQFMASVAVCSLLAAVSLCLRLEGLSGDLTPSFVWRWSLTPEQRAEAWAAEQAERQPVALRTDDDQRLVEAAANDWPGFRGPRRDGVVRGRLEWDWSKAPEELWRAPIGPGWSSFSVVQGRAYTQEQRGPNEVVSCRDAQTGVILWETRTKGRFEDTSSGVGPRSTPAYASGKLFSLSANGMLTAVDANGGDVLWEFDLMTLEGAELPHWGFASSPLVVNNKVFVFSGAGSGNSVVALDCESGKRLWSAGDGRLSYGSPHLLSLSGRTVLLQASERGLDAFDASSGHVVWGHAWEIGLSARIVQPCVLPGGDVLLATGYGKGTRRLKIELDAVQTVWTSKRFKPYFSDFVHHNGSLYGFDADILTCLDVEDGKRRWRQRGFGNGQLLLLESSERLLVLSETGRVSLIKARSDRLEVGLEFEALDGKTWNHPAVSGNLLLLRNGAEAVCYRLSEIRS